MLRKIGIITLFFVQVFFACKTHHSVTKTEAVHQGFKSASSSQKQDSIIQVYKNTLTAKITKTLAVCTDNLTKDGVEMTLGNFVCDAVKWAFDSITQKNNNCIVLMNRGGLRTNINKGIITVNSIFELMPFENKLELVEIEGKVLQQMLPLIIEKKHAFLGMKIVTFTKEKYLVTIAGKEIDSTQTYRVLTSDFLINGGDNFTFGNKKLSSISPDLKIRDALIYYCMHLTLMHKTITPFRDGRFEFSK